LERVAILIDGGYFAKLLELDFSRPKVDFHKFSENVCEGYERLRTYYYTCMPYQSNPPTDEERRRYSAMDKFIYTLQKLPRFEVRLGKLGWAGNELVQKRVDILFAVDLVRLSWGRQIGKAILVTGDSDFVPAVLAAKDAGVLVQLYYSPNSVHDELLSAVDESFMITEELIEKAKL
jgi:uncharacterized LabA/DUF88 family protein